MGLASKPAVGNGMVLPLKYLKALIIWVKLNLQQSPDTAQMHIRLSYTHVTRKKYRRCVPFLKVNIIDLNLCYYFINIWHIVKIKRYTIYASKCDAGTREKIVTTTAKYQY